MLKKFSIKFTLKSEYRLLQIFLSMYFTSFLSVDLKIISVIRKGLGGNPAKLPERVQLPDVISEPHGFISLKPIP